MCAKCTTTARALLHQVYQCVRIGGRKKGGGAAACQDIFCQDLPFQLAPERKSLSISSSPASYLYYASVFVLYLYLY